ncbi:hypothetical protein ACSFA0_23450 [Variovorax sp. LT1P1]
MPDDAFLIDAKKDGVPMRSRRFDASAQVEPETVWRGPALASQ